MASSEPDRRVRLSVLDRLIDEEPDRPTDPIGGWEDSVARHKAAVLRDLEWLLNTRRTPETAPEDLPEVRRSLYHYGLPDLSSLSADSTADRRHLLREVERTLERFEPRLENIRVTVRESDEAEGKPRVRFAVEGLLRMEPEPEKVSFDTVLELASGRFDIDEG